MTDDSEPRWDLLPLQLESFFGLEGEYDLRDLKRSYNKLIRRFKPEKFPEEFQKIRSAYESLNDALRYREADGIFFQGNDTQIHWNTSYDSHPEQSPSDQQDELESGQQPEAHNDGQADPQASFNSNFPPHSENAFANQNVDELLPKSQQLPLYQRVTEEPPDLLYQEFKNKQEKTPFDYYALAVLSDVVEDDPLLFSRWLLQGLEEHSNEQGLFQLLREHLTSDIPSDSIESLLKDISQVVRGDRFYYLTERLWGRFLREAPFECFKETLEICETDLLDHQFDHQITFYLHLLKPALWKADDAWLSETFNHVERNFESLSAWAEYELDFLDSLRTYKERRSEFVEGGGPMRGKIDQAIVSCCLDDEPTADRNFLECQQILTTNSEQLFQEFPVPAEGFEYITLLWERIANEVQERVGGERIEVDNDLRKRQVRNLAYRLMVEGDKRGFELVYNSYLILLFIWLVSAIGSVCYLGYHLIVDLFVKGEFGNAMWDLLYLGGVFLVSLAMIAMIFLIEAFVSRRFYRNCWRHLIRNFFQSSLIPLHDVADEIESLEDEEVNERKIDYSEQIANMLRKDFGMFFYATAQRLMV